MGIVHVVDHPLVQHKLSLMRNKDTSTTKFRALMREVSFLLGYEATRHLPLSPVEIETPVATMQAPMLAEKNSALISILRAGNGLLDGMIQLMPTAKIGHVGLYRNETAGAVVEYYLKFPKDISERNVIVLDPMLATGHSAVAAVARLKQAKVKRIDFVCLLASPEGLEFFHDHHPEVEVITASVDQCLNERSYIVPGLGDAGDRLFGTQ
ncbi:MAG: uracil phosphoribosyltransferase [Oligoflexales bacterium]